MQINLTGKDKKDITFTENDNGATVTISIAGNEITIPMMDLVRTVLALRPKAFFNS